MAELEFNELFLKICDFNGLRSERPDSAFGANFRLTYRLTPMVLLSILPQDAVRQNTTTPDIERHSYRSYGIGLKRIPT
jgi:hypothetical protein